MSSSVGQLKRKRSRIACEPCRERKRKCNGGNPCTTCSNWGYDCYYENLSRPKRQSLPDPYVPPRASSPSGQIGSQASADAKNPPSDSRGLVQHLEANSGAAFVRKMGLKVDPANAPKLNLFGWNTGPRQLASGLGAGSALPIVDIASLNDIKALADVYFAKVDPCYGFIGQRQFFERLEKRWRSPLTTNVHDSVIAGVSALGSLFSRRNATITEIHLVETARSFLDLHDQSGAPSIDLVTGWTLRVVYMRMTASPYSMWIASSTLMHLIEAAGLHLESSCDTVLPRVKCDPDIRRRLVGVAQHLNMWTSFDLGLSRVALQNGPPLAPSTKPGDYTTELLNLLPVSASLDPENAQDDRALETSLSQILDGKHTQPPSVLAQCNLALCILRRLRILNLSTSPTVIERVLALLRKGLRSARTMVTNCCPWHHVANVPFHIICVLLVMDTRASLGLLPEAMQTLKFVASTYDTSTMREAYSTAGLLVLLHQQRRNEDIQLFSGVLSMHDQVEIESPPPQQLDPSPEELLWLEGLVSDMPSLQKVDLDQFLNSDMMESAAGDVLDF